MRRASCVLTRLRQGPRMGRDRFAFSVPRYWSFVAPCSFRTALYGA